VEARGREMGRQRRVDLRQRGSYMTCRPGKCTSGPRQVRTALDAYCRRDEDGRSPGLQRSGSRVSRRRINGANKLGRYDLPGMAGS
jgi:hypothetical protein